MLGMHGTAYANHAVHNCDLLIAVGARFDDRVTGKLAAFAKKAKVIHIDIDPAEINKTVSVDAAVIGDCKEILTRLTARVDKREESDWNRQIMQWRNEFALECPMDESSLSPQCVINKLSELTNGEAIVVTDVGQHQMFSALFYKVTKPRRWLSSGGLGTMGYGFPAAIGAQVAKPDSIVIDIDGDSSFSMILQELATAVQYQLPIKVCILNNGYMGMVRQWQQLFYNRRYSKSALISPDFAAVANAFGAVGIKVENKADVPAVIERMLAEKKPCIVDFHVEREENVWPMVPAGKSLHEMDGLDILERLA
jgi:acetolactate synthase-1/2/3 large subunit